MDASVVITTKNRKEDLRRAVASALRQQPAVEVLVMDDGSTDGTAEMVRVEFSKAVLHRFEESKGYIVRRNQGARLATGKIIFSIDDDAEFSTPNIVAQTLMEFGDPRVGAVAIPYIEPHKKNCLLQQAPDGQTVWLTDRFIGTSHALRRNVFVELGGYREHFVHQGEEGDYCIRLLGAGYFVRLGNADTIIHHESPKRDYRRMDFYGRRNDVLFVWHNVPLPVLPLNLLATALNGLRWGIKVKRPAIMVFGGLCGFAACLRFWGQRRPVSRGTYHLFRKLKFDGALSTAKGFPNG